MISESKTLNMCKMFYVRNAIENLGHFCMHMTNIISLLFILCILFFAYFVDSGIYCPCAIKFNLHPKLYINEWLIIGGIDANTSYQCNRFHGKLCNQFNNNKTHTVLEDNTQANYNNFVSGNYATLNNAASLQHFIASLSGSAWRTKTVDLKVTLSPCKLSIVKESNNTNDNKQGEVPIPASNINNLQCLDPNHLIRYNSITYKFNKPIAGPGDQVEICTCDDIDVCSGPTFDLDDVILYDIADKGFSTSDTNYLTQNESTTFHALPKQDPTADLTSDPATYDQYQSEHLTYDYVCVFVFIIAIVACIMIISNVNFIKYSTFYLAVVLVLTHGTYAKNDMQKLTANDGSASDWFGRSVAIYENWLVIGAWLDDDNGDNSGSAYVFKLVNGIWNETQKLLPNDVIAHDYFGTCVDIYHNYLVVCAGYQGHNVGAAYVFKLVDGIWLQVQKLLANDDNGDSRFGKSVSIYGEWIVVGAYLDEDHGSAYVFKLMNGMWSQTQTLVSHDGSAGNYFGGSVAIWEHYMVVSAYEEDNDEGNHTGSAYVFNLTNGIWNETQELLSNDIAAYDRFGYRVDIYGHYIVVGAYGNDDLGSNTGSAYVFKLVNGIWNQVQKLLANDGSANDYFGGAVAIYGDYLIVEASNSQSNTGSVYVFKLVNGLWNQVQKILANDGSANEYLTGSVDIYQNWLLIGARNDDDSGAAYVMHSYDSCNSISSLVNTHNNYLLNFTWTTCDLIANPPFCTYLDVTVTDGFGFDKSKFEGEYLFIDDAISNDRPVFEVPETPNDKNIQYIGVSPNGHWIINGEGPGTLSFGPTDFVYPPYGITSTQYYWTHNSVTGQFHLLIQCISSFAPTSSPSSSPNSSSLISTKQLFLYVIIIGVIGVILIIVLILYCKKAATHTVERRKKSVFIRNPMVILVGIGDYDEPENVDPEIEGYLPNLDVNIDITNLWGLFHDKLKYDTFPKYDDPQHPKLDWKQDELIRFLTEKATSFEYHVRTNTENTNKDKRDYDGLIVAVSCHGVDGGFLVTSDYRRIHKDVVHRLFTSYHERSREVPRIILYDCCSGYEDRKGSIKKNKQTRERLVTEVVKPFTINDIIRIEEEEKKCNDTKDTGKTYTTKEIEPETMVKKTSTFAGLWGRYAQNPDNQLVTAHASNAGFQSKMNSQDGSYFTNQFVERTMKSLEKDVADQPFLHEIFDKIQEELGEKKQLPVITYNNNTRYVKFTKNNDPPPSKTNNEIIEMVSTNINDSVGINVNDEGEENKFDTITSSSLSSLEKLKQRKKIGSIEKLKEQSQDLLNTDDKKIHKDHAMFDRKAALKQDFSTVS